MLRDITNYIITALAGGVFTLILSIIIWGPASTLSAFRAIQSQLSAQLSMPIVQTQVLGDSILDSRILGLQTNPLTAGFPDLKSSGLPYPLIVPTDGIAGSGSHLFSPAHVGIDIWTRLDGKGLNGSSEGNPVYAACTGTVIRVYIPNEEIEVLCDRLPDKYATLVPSLKIKTLYAHMGDAVTGVNFHSLKNGQRLNKGELIGYQGNRSSIAPYNRVTHLHFGIYDLSKSGRPAINPAIYIGVPTTVYLQQFSMGQHFYSK